MIMSPCCQGEHHFCYEEGLVCHIDELYYLWQWASLNTRDSAVSLTMTRSCHEDSDDHDDHDDIASDGNYDGGEDNEGG